MSTTDINSTIASRRSTRRTALAALTRGLLAGLLLGGFFGAGFLLRGALPSNAAPAYAGGLTETQLQALEYPLLAQAQALLTEHYLRDLPEQTTLEYGAIRGLVGTLNDRLTFFIDPPVAAAESNVLAGQYGGIGVQLVRDQMSRFVLYPFRDGPAARAGVLDGDVLLRVNGVDVPINMQQDAADQLLRGEVRDYNGVTIIVQRAAEGSEADETHEYFIRFEVIEVPSVIWRTLPEDPDFGYIQILRFTSRTPNELQTAITELRDADIRALVLDLRSNPGGLLQESIQVASQFLPDDVVVLYERTRDGEREYLASGGGRLVDLPMVVLVNHGTASAAEIVAGALRDHNRATLIGQRTFGKGSVQLIFQLADRSSLHITTAEFFPPGRGMLEGQGIVPNVELIPDPAGRDMELATGIGFLRERFAQG
jgi:carboxyl-terminal processing protease